METAATLSGAIELIETIVIAWSGLRLGPGPEMSPDYDYLVSKIGIFPPSFDNEVQCGGVAADLADWRQARQIFDRATSNLSEIENFDLRPDILSEYCVRSIGEVDALFEGIREPFRERVFRKVGALNKEFDESDEGD